MSDKKNFKKKSNEINITRKNIYFSDIMDPDALHGILIRSPIEKGSIQSVTIPNLPKDYRIITAQDIPLKNELLIGNIKIPLLAWEKISFLGEPIALLVGKSLEKLIELKKKIEIKATPSTEEDSNQTNFIATRQINFGESELLFTNSDIKIEKNYVSNIHNTSSNECIGAFCEYSKKGLKIYSPTKNASSIMYGITNVLGCSLDELAIVKTKTDSATTNSIINTKLTAILAALASKITEKNIKIMLSRSEINHFIDNSIDVKTEFHFAVEPNGKIMAMNADIKLDVGAFCPFAQEIIDKIVIALAGIYRFENYSITAFAFTSNKYPISYDIQFADFISFFSLESIFQYISQTLKISPIELRKANFELKNTKQESRIAINNSPLKEIIDTAAKKSDFLRKYSCYSLSAKADSRFPLKGIGLSCAFEGNGYYGELSEDKSISIELMVDKNENAIIKATAPTRQIEHIWQNSVKKFLSIPIEKIKLEETEENYDIDKHFLFQSFTRDYFCIKNELLKKCCTTLKTQITKEKLPVSVKKNLSKSPKWNSREFKGIPFSSTSWVSAVAEIEIDRNTYMLKIIAIWIVINSGEIFDRLTAERSIKKAILLTLKMCLPQYTYTNANMYVDFIETTDDPKELGSLVYNALPGAITNAISVALQKEISALPVASDMIYYSLTSSEKDKKENSGEKSDDNQV